MYISSLSVRHYLKFFLSSWTNSIFTPFVSKMQLTIFSQGKHKDYMFCSPVKIQCAEDNGICTVKCKQLRQTLKIQTIRLKQHQGRISERTCAIQTNTVTKLNKLYPVL